MVGRGRAADLVRHVQKFDDSMSGTTAIVCFFKGAELTVANVGDSRAIVGEKKGHLDTGLFNTAALLPFLLAAAQRSLILLTLRDET